MIYPIYLYGQQVLRQVAEDITPDYPGLKTLLDDMFATMHKSDGIGLAAPQIGLPIRVLVIDLDRLSEEHPEYKGVKLVLINAHITHRSSNMVTQEEGCLSLPDIHERVSRPDAITVDYLDAAFAPQQVTYEGFLARVVQHEYDHLEGKLFIDHISPIRKQLIKGKLNNLLKGKVNCSYRTK